MGMESRRYAFRIGSGVPGSLITPAIKWLLIANIAVFFLQVFESAFLRTNLLVQWFGLIPRAVTHGLRLWQPFTYLFLHGGFWHIFFNMLALWMFGCDIERAWGRRRFLNYYFLTGVGAGLINVLVKTIADPSGQAGALIPTIGASGAIYGILIAAAILFPDRQIWIIPFPVMIPMRVYAAIVGAFAFLSALGSGTGDNVSHVTHLGGMLVGWWYIRRGSLFFGLRNTVSDWKRRRLRRKFEVYMRNQEKEPPSRPDNWLN